MNAIQRPNYIDQPWASNNRHKIIIISLVFAISSILFIDNFAFTSAGLVVSYTIFATNILLSLRRLSWGIILTLFVSYYIPDQPRNILNLYHELQVDKSVEFYTLGTITVTKLTLLNILFIFNTLLASYKIFSTKSKYRFGFIFIPICMILFGSVSSLYSIAIGDTFAFRSITSDLKLPLFLIFGFMQGLYLTRTNAFDLLIKIIFLLPFLIGIRALLFIGSDIALASPSFYFATNTTISVSVLSFLVATKSKSVYSYWPFRMGLYMSLIEPSRGYLIILSITLLAAYFSSFFFKANLCQRSKTNYITELLFIGFFILFLAGLYNPVFYDFAVWKLNVFSEIFFSDQQLNESGSLRISEFLNVISEISNSIYQFIFGKGLGGAYTFNTFPFQSSDPLDLKSFSDNQLSTGIYYAAHSFSTFMLLKYGIVGLTMYIFIPFRIIKSLLRSSKIQPIIILLIFISATSIYYFYWRLDLAFLLSAIWAYTFNQYPRSPQPLNRP